MIWSFRGYVRDFEQHHTFELTEYEIEYAGRGQDVEQQMNRDLTRLCLSPKGLGWQLPKANEE